MQQDLAEQHECAGHVQPVAVEVIQADASVKLLGALQQWYYPRLSE
jgi:hypothetical protein